jgi:hypothetical protein
LPEEFFFSKELISDQNIDYFVNIPANSAVILKKNN